MPELPLLVYDGDCAICQRMAKRAGALIGRRHVMASQVLAEEHRRGLTDEDFGRSVWWIPESGPPRCEHEAVADTMRFAGLPWSILGRVLLVWPISLAARSGYRWVAKNRARLGSPSCDVPERPQS